ncbi:MAG: hypothetical protein KF910_04280 [Brevundimonas sp.]|uniref:type II toxin-antitoxin system RelE/ParE family toxin n=1 Tax=Brevundimonas sp. TaxID=1871086 RepID=UPI0025C728D3|nr:hypothetical protein [Brevundimonas sp.]MBX3476799.1 hypothetical protein [Brevundimonas sp.]
MAADVLISAKARRQLGDLLTMIAMDSPSGARRLEAAVSDLFVRIGEFPESCPLIGGTSVRMGVAARRIHVLYRVAGVRVFVLRVVYAGYDLRQAFD